MSASCLRCASALSLVLLGIYHSGVAAQTPGSPTTVMTASSDPFSGASGTAPATPAAVAPATSGTIQLGQIEAQQRAQVTIPSFSTNFSALPSSGGDYADARYVLGQTSPALFTLPGDGISQGVVILKPCAIFSPHLHPRASEIIYVQEGTVNVSFVEENPVPIDGVSVGGRTLNYTLSVGGNVAIPQGLVHFISNSGPSCSNATVITSFNNRDPGTVSITQVLFNLDPLIVQAATGLQSQLQETARAISTKTPIIGVDTTCQQRCAVANSANSAGRRRL